jgi:hypothetical protein
MMIRTIVWGLAGVIVFSGAARSQSLADIARKEAERRKTILVPGKVYTDADLRRFPVAPPPEPPPGDSAIKAGEAEKPAAKPEQAATTDTPEKPSIDSGEQYWRTLITDARAALARSSSYLVALQERAQTLTIQSYTLEDPAARNAAAAQRSAVVKDLKLLKQDMAAQEEAIAKIEADARKANIPPGWIR